MKRIAAILAILGFILPMIANSCAEAGVRRYKVRVVKEYPHDVTSYTQGLFFDGGKLYESTGQSSTLEYKQTRRYPREGWGLTTDGKSLVASDGSSLIYFMDKDFKVEKTLKVRMNGRPLSNLNELEFIDGKIWANVYLTDMIVIINPSSGVVEASIDCTGLLPRHLRTRETDVLNGIARDSATGKIYLTGKNWKRLYEIELTEKK